MNTVINNNNKLIQVLNGKNNINHKLNNYVIKLGHNKYLFARIYDADNTVDKICDEVFPSNEDEKLFVQFLDSDINLLELKETYLKHLADGE